MVKLYPNNALNLKSNFQILFRVKDKTAEYTRAIGKHGRKETSSENYADSLRKKFSSLVDTPKWADLDHRKEEGDSDDEFFRVNNFCSILMNFFQNVCCSTIST